MTNLETFEEKLELKDLSFLRLKVLLLILQCCSLLGDSAPITAFVAYLSLADTFLILGYSGRAAVALSAARDLLQLATKTEELQFQLKYGDYLDQINNHEKLLQLHTSISSKGADESNLIQSAVNRLEARIRFCEGSYNEALESAIGNYKWLSKQLKCSEIMVKNKSESIDFSKELFANLVLISEIYKFKGIPLASEYYLKQGHDLATKIGAKYFQWSFGVEISSLKKATSDTKNLDSVIQKLKDFPNFAGAKQRALCRIALGDHCSNGTTDSSLAVADYELAIENITEELKSSTIDKLDGQVFGKKDASAIDLAKKSTGLELVKSEAHCKLANIYVTNGDIKRAEEELQLAGLKLTAMKELVTEINPGTLFSHHE